MKTLIRSISLGVLAVLILSAVPQGGHGLTNSPASIAPERSVVKVNHTDSAQISNLLVDARTHARLAAAEADLLYSMTKNTTSAWQLYGQRLSQMRDTVNALGKVNAQLFLLKGEGSPWQQIAITRIDLHVRALAGQVTQTIVHFSAHQDRVSMPFFVNQLRANNTRASETAALISDFVDYGKARAAAPSTIDKLEQKLGLPRNYGGF